MTYGAQILDGRTKNNSEIGRAVLILVVFDCGIADNTFHYSADHCRTALSKRLSQTSRALEQRD